MSRLSSQLGYLISKIDVEPVKLREVFELFSREAGIFYNRTVLDLEVNIPEELWVVANKGVLHLILINLIKNCAYHKDPKTQKVYIRAFEQGNYVRVEFKNKGKIERRFMRKIFKAGTKGNRSKGMGLGLHNSKRQARLMGGDLRVDLDRANNDVIVTLKLKKRGGKI